MCAIVIVIVVVIVIVLAIVTVIVAATAMTIVTVIVIVALWPCGFVIAGVTVIVIAGRCYAILLQLSSALTLWHCD